MGNLHSRQLTRGNPLRIPTVVEVIDNDPLLGFKISDRASDEDFNFFGYLRADGQFYILREEIAEGKYRYFKGGPGGYVTAWEQRADQNYDYFDLIF
jgi:hypothetical protein